jgi:hypothetical protein
MECVKNGFVIAYPGARKAFLRADKFECKDCGSSVIAQISADKSCGFRMSDAAYAEELERAEDPTTGIVLKDDLWVEGAPR